MTKAVEVITSVQRRRRWTRAEKERLVAAALAPGAVASEVAREPGIRASQLFRWRQELCLPAPQATFSVVAVLSEPASARSSVSWGSLDNLGEPSCLSALCVDVCDKLGGGTKVYDLSGARKTVRDSPILHGCPDIGGDAPTGLVRQILRSE